MRAFLTAALGVWLVVLLASNSQSKPFNLQEVSKRSQLSKDRQDRTDEKSGRLEQSERFAIRDEGMANPIVHTGFEKRGISKNDEESKGFNEQVLFDRTKEIPSSDLNSRGIQVSAVSFNGLQGRGSHDRYARTAESFFKRADNDGGGIVRKTVEWSVFHPLMILDGRNRAGYIKTMERIDQRLGPPLAKSGDDISSLILTSVDDVDRQVQELDLIFEERQICGWLEAKVLSREKNASGQIEIVRYVPEGCWPEEIPSSSASSSRPVSPRKHLRPSLFRTFSEQRHKTASGNLLLPTKVEVGSKNVDMKKYAVKISWELVERLADGFRGDDVTVNEKKDWLIKRQWKTRPRGKTELIFFNVSLDQVESTKVYLENLSIDDLFPTVEIVAGKDGKYAEDDKCSLRFSLPVHQHPSHGGD